MSVTLEIELPEGDAAMLLEEASRQGISVSELVQRWLRRNGIALPSALTEEQYASDPLWSVCGMTRTAAADTSVNHDQYLYDEDQ